MYFVEAMTGEEKFKVDFGQGYNTAHTSALAVRMRARSSTMSAGVVVIVVALDFVHALES